MIIPKLTTVVLAHELNSLLDACLGSLLPSEKILIVWNGKSAEAKKMKLPKQAMLIYENLPIKDFATIRNKALSHVTTEWCLMLDSDEVVPLETWEAWQQEISDTKCNGFYVKRLDFFLGRKLEWGELKNQWHLRLFKTKMTTFERPVHEVAVVQGEITRSSGSITHYPHQTISEFISDTSAYAKLEAVHRQKQSKTWNSIETITYPIGKFFYNLFWNQAWRDGFPGIIYTFIMSAHSFWVRVYLYERIHVKNN
jgi:hypothetical protein